MDGIPLWQSKRFKGFVAGLIGIVTVMMLAPQKAEAARIELVTCKKLVPEGSVFGSDLKRSQCGTQFTTKDDYVGIVIHLRDVRDKTKVEVELLDPEQLSVWKIGGTVALPEEMYYESYWIFGVLPIGADIRSIVQGDPKLLMRIIPIPGKPARERLGEWTLSARTDGGPALILKFTVQTPPE